MNVIGSGGRCFGVAYSEMCPECGERYASRCRCAIGNMTCAQGHQWYRGGDGMAWSGTGHAASVDAAAALARASEATIADAQLLAYDT